MNRLKTDPAFRRGWQVVDLRPPRRERPLRETAELDPDPVDLPLEADADRWERPRRIDLAEPLAPERPGDDEPQQGPQFPAGAPWEVTEAHAARWRLHNFEHRRGDTNHFRSLGDLSDSEFALFLWDLSMWKGMVKRWGTVVLQGYDQDGQPCDPHAPRPPRKPVRCEEKRLGPKPPPLEVHLREGREHWGEIGVLLREWYDLLGVPGG